MEDGGWKIENCCWRNDIVAEIKSFRDLNAYKKAREEAKLVFEVSQTFPREERYSLTDQIRRSSRAVNAMVAEAWARRRYEAVFVNKLDEALGEANEVRAWLDGALDSGYLPADRHQSLDAQYVSVSGMLSRMIDRADDFCKFAPDKDYRQAKQTAEM